MEQDLEVSLNAAMFVLNLKGLNLGTVTYCITAS